MKDSFKGSFGLRPMKDSFNGSFGEGPRKCQKEVGFIDSVKHVSKRDWFYRLCPKKYLKEICFIDSVQKSIKKRLAL